MVMVMVVVMVMVMVWYACICVDLYIYIYMCVCVLVDTHCLGLTIARSFCDFRIGMLWTPYGSKQLDKS